MPLQDTDPTPSFGGFGLMSEPWFLALWTIAAYVVGSVPFGDMVSRAAGVDIRSLGTGNPGTSNIFREIGTRYAIAVFVLDVLKGGVEPGDSTAILATTLVIPPELLEASGGHLCLFLSQAVIGILRWRARQRACQAYRQDLRRHLVELGKPALRRSRPAFGQRRTCGRALVVVRGRERAAWRRGAVRWEWNEANYAGGGMYEPDEDGGKADVPDTPV